MPTGWMVDAEQKGGRCRPEGSMLRGSPTRPKKSQNVKQSELRKKPEFRKILERRTVEGPTRPESTGTLNNQNTNSIGNTGVLTRPENAETPKSRNF
jgi:hypothetical protein